MSKSIALRNYSGNNPGLRLVGAVIPGTRNFNQAIARVFHIACVIGFVCGALYLLGGNWKSLLQLKPLVAMLGLTFALEMHEVGFHHALSGIISAVIGAHKSDGEFNQQLRASTRRAAHIFALLNAIYAWDSITTLPDFLHRMTPAVYGYFYAVMLGIVLRTQKERGAGAKTSIVDQVLPVAFMALCYVVYTRWL